MRRRLTLTLLSGIFSSLAGVVLLLANSSAEQVPSSSYCALSRYSCGGEGPEIDMGGAFRPTRLPKKKPAPVDLVLQGSEFLAGPAALKEAVFEIDRNVALDARGLATCSPHRLWGPDTVPGACDPAQVGKGELEVEVAFSEQQPFILKSHLVAFNAGVKGGVAKILVKGYLPPPASAVFGTTVEVSKVDHGRYGTRWTIPIPIIAGGSGSVKEFRLGFFRRFTYRRKRRSYLLGLCRDGRLLARGEAIFEDGTDVPGKFARPCTPGS